MRSRREIKKRVDDYLADLFASRARQASKLSSRYVTLWENIARLANNGGKRLRPYLACLAYEAYGGELPSEKVLAASAAVELLHLSLLVHDDIIDEDFERYGQPNIAGNYIAEYSKNVDKDRVEHYASSAALLAGNLLLIEAGKLISGLNDEQLTSFFNEAIFVVAGGELADLESKIIETNLDHLEISRQKTASYSFVLPLTIGASLAEANQSELAKLRLLANQLGVIYQLKDDLADGEANHESAEVDIRDLQAASHEQIDELAIKPTFRRTLKKLF